MKRHNIMRLLTISALAILVGGCTQTISQNSGQKYYVDKDASINKINAFYKQYTTSNKKEKAIAVAMDKEGKYVLGYAHDAASAQSAKKIALSRCEQARTKTNVTIDAPCKLYAADNQIVAPLK